MLMYGVCQLFAKTNWRTGLFYNEAGHVFLLHPWSLEDNYKNVRNNIPLFSLCTMGNEF